MSKNITCFFTKNLSTITKNYNYYNLLTINNTIIRLQNTNTNTIRGCNDNDNCDLSKTDKYEHKSYKSYLDEQKSSSSIAIDALTKLPKLTRNAASKTVSEWKIFQTLSKATILQNYDLLHENGVEQSTLKDHPYALADTTINIKNKITICHDIKLDITDAISLFKLSITELKLFRQTHEKDKLLLDQYPNRIEYLAHSLDVSIFIQLSFNCFNKNLYYLILFIKLFFKYILEVGVTGEHILCDLHVYKFSHKTVRTRVNRAIKAQINPIKPWVVRCPLSIIVNAENKLAKRKLLLDGADSLEVYISNIMNCSIESSEAFLKRGIKIDKISLPDLTKKLKFLRDKGYTIEDIYRLPSCLHASYNTLVQKYDLWIKMGFTNPPLFAICTSQKVFETRLENELKNKMINNS
ncbi:hypothetical protein HCN44_009663 [Aphidius gifuensis]|uniref:Uncharacterized protein n=1 Tax=Aphidius gifuensis TaxID=684658 RepID=A0A834Y2N4_APHGI|nr:hypothetical protein HCN44_009663 [Aphidius gifuensis]